MKPTDELRKEIEREALKIALEAYNKAKRYWKRKLRELDEEILEGDDDDD